MYSQDSSSTQVTFHYLDGHAEGYKIPLSPQELQAQIQGLLDKPWLTFHLRDQTVVINTAHILKIEIKPPVSQLEGEAVFPNSERVTALTRSTR